MDSIQAECRATANRLAARGVTFTEKDVVEHTAMPNWSVKELAKAQRAAYAVLQGDYRKGRLVRYGPVQINGSEDYVRNNSKIVYASATKGPGFVETPNGIFHRLTTEEDYISSVGRRPGINRDDLEPWDIEDNNGHGHPTTTLLEIENDAELDRLATLLAPRVEAKVRLALSASMK